MKLASRLTILVATLLLARSAPAQEKLPPIPPITRVLPPEGLEIPADIRQRLETRLAETKKRLERVKLDERGTLRPIKSQYRKADVEIFTKAVELALLHREFYTAKDFDKADWALDQANERIDALSRGEEVPWERKKGLVVLGYRSQIDESAQPYGLVIPEDHDFAKPAPLYVWLHGRGDKNTDLHFLHERATKLGQITPSNAIVIHPFGRHCVGWKHAGEIDVLDAVLSVRRRYQIDADRVVLIGFSMGGAGAWHLGAHYTEQWVAVSPGAGFAETARYQNLTPDKYPPRYEQTLWGLYDVPNYVRSLFNTQVLAYSGENDKQIQAARIMEQAYAAEGQTLTHLIGPGVEHKYELGTLEDLMRRLDRSVSKGRQEIPKEVHLQTRTLRYGAYGWIGIHGLEQHWEDSRVDATIVNAKLIQVATKNISALRLYSPPVVSGTTVAIDGQELEIPTVSESEFSPQLLFKKGGKWTYQPKGMQPMEYSRLAKFPNEQGPIDDAFMGRFYLVAPTGRSRNAAFQAWSNFELAHFSTRWRALMRGEPLVVSDTVLAAGPPAGADDPLFLSLVLWGDPDSNCSMPRFLKDTPVRFQDGKWLFGGKVYDGNRFVISMVYPRKTKTGEYSGYIVLNSGLTFREGHDRTNSLQNPKLPDWAIIDMTQPPDAFSPGRIHDAGFFDEQWQLKNSPKGP